MEVNESRFQIIEWFDTKNDRPSGYGIIMYAMNTSLLIRDGDKLSFDTRKEAYDYAKGLSEKMRQGGYQSYI